MTQVAALVLAAGRSSRMRGPNKLLATFEGVPLVRRTAEIALASRACLTLVVVGHEGEEVATILDGLPVAIVRNDRFAEGLSTSLRVGFDAARHDAEGVLVMLADQPALQARHLDALIEAFRPSGPGSIVVATHDGHRGNPVVLSAAFAGKIAAITGDKGARDLIVTHSALVREVEIGAAALVDVDTPEAMHEAGGVLPTHAPWGRS